MHTLQAKQVEPATICGAHTASRLLDSATICDAHIANKLSRTCFNM